MCTLTWLRSDGRCELFFNRDEQVNRSEALAPRVHRRGEASWIAPVDADAGGTWLGVNDLGVAVGLMNGYRPVPGQGPFESRGLLVDALLDAPSTEALRERLARLDLRRYRSFALVALEPDLPLLRARWDGAGLELARLEDGEQPLSSSSKDPQGAAANRREVFQAELRRAGGPSPELLERFHASHAPERGALSVCMHRADARTVSLTRVRIDARRVELGYAPGPPCEAAPARWLHLSRARAPRGA